MLTKAREQGDGEECEEDEDQDSSEEEDVVTEFPAVNGIGNNTSSSEVREEA